MSDQHYGPSASPAQHRFGVGLDDLIIWPLVLIAFATQRVLQKIVLLSITIFDYAFPILLQLVRFPLFTVRILGDGIVALLSGVVRFIPMPAARREEWRAVIRRSWAWLRQKFSYKAFEEAIHHAFEGGMAWVFRNCRALTPTAALMVIFGAMLWLPISFGIATAIHAILLAEATSLPAWMQLLHPLATLIAKSKLLVLPVYPAAWPQAKKHPAVQAMFGFYTYLSGLAVMRKIGQRYDKTASAGAEMAAACVRAAERIGWPDLVEQFKLATTEAGHEMRFALRQTIAAFARLPVIGALVRRYVKHYGDTGDSEKLSVRTRALFARWSTNFTAEYYEAKDRDAQRA
ncbi:MAG: hypothetical protein JO134_12885 [Xanthobacteraceae bacterium]|nr:hypothetical protein [Xanthobacteraceae bacterium]